MEPGRLVDTARVIRRAARWCPVGVALVIVAAACTPVTRPPPPPPPPAPPPVVDTGDQNGSLGACPVFPADNAWNADVSSWPVRNTPTVPALDPADNSAAILAGLPGNLHADFGGGGVYGIPYVTVPGTHPRVPVNFTEFPAESDPGPYPVPLAAPIEAGSDAHVIAIDRDACRLYELYHASPNGAQWDAGSGATWDLRSDAVRPAGWTSADAAGLPIFPGLARFDEVASGAIHHALRVTVRTTRHGYIYPARHFASSDASPTVPPMGMRFRLKASFDLTPYRGEALVILRALQQYGMIVADNGSNWFITGAADRRWDDNDLNQLKSVPGSAFDVVGNDPVTTH